jgi:hypothetical protein
VFAVVHVLCCLCVCMCVCERKCVLWCMCTLSVCLHVSACAQYIARILVGVRFASNVGANQGHLTDYVLS